MISPLEAESQRLGAYYPFNTTVLETVALAADANRSTSWQEIRSKLPDTSIFNPAEGNPVEILDIMPQGDYENTYVYHLPMANSIDPNIMTRLAVLSQVLPTSRIVATGNPTHPFKSTGKIPLRNLPAVWNGDLRPVVRPTLEYISSQGIEEVAHIGYSYGADRAAAAAAHGGAYDHHVRGSVFMEPAGIEKRGIVGLGRAFGDSAVALPQYLAAADSRALNEARGLAEQESHGAIGFAGLLRASNLAITHALSGGAFADRVRDALNVQIDMSVALIWGTESEIATHGVMQHLHDRLRRSFPERITAVTVPGQKHAMGDDIFLHAALVAQGIHANAEPQ